MEKIEKKTADAILQKPHKIKLHGISFTVPQPTIATLIRVSELVAELPTTDAENPMAVLKDLKNCGIIGDIIATLIVGERRRKWYELGYKRRYRRLSKWVVENCSPAELCSLLGDIMVAMQVEYFFVLSSSLKGVSLIRGEETTTASGQSSQE